MGLVCRPRWWWKHALITMAVLAGIAGYDIQQVLGPEALIVAIYWLLVAIIALLAYQEYECREQKQ